MMCRTCACTVCGVAVPWCARHSARYSSASVTGSGSTPANRLSVHARQRTPLSNSYVRTRDTHHGFASSASPTIHPAAPVSSLFFSTSPTTRTFPLLTTGMPNASTVRRSSVTRARSAAPWRRRRAETWRAWRVSQAAPARARRAPSSCSAPPSWTDPHPPRATSPRLPAQPKPSVSSSSSGSPNTPPGRVVDVVVDVEDVVVDGIGARGASTWTT